MNYYLDTEFLEGTQKSWVSSKPTIDLISIGIVCEDGREYYAVSKDFNLKEAWNRFQIKPSDNTIAKARRKGFTNTNTFLEKEYWLRNNVLKLIIRELYLKDELEKWSNQVTIKTLFPIVEKNVNDGLYDDTICNYKEFKRLINKYGKTNKQIAEEVKDFCIEKNNKYNIGFREIVYAKNDINKQYPHTAKGYNDNRNSPIFYGYFCDYDWIVFCWLFGKMIDLPKGFPMYCRDLKQDYDRLEEYINSDSKYISPLNIKECFIESRILKGINLKSHVDYPKQINEHNALADAKWTKQLHEFLNNL